MSLCVQECVIHVSKNVFLDVVHWRQSYLDSIILEYFLYELIIKLVIIIVVISIKLSVKYVCRKLLATTIFNYFIST